MSGILIVMRVRIAVRRRRRRRRNFSLRGIARQKEPRRTLADLPATQSFSSLPLLSSRVFNRARSQIRLGSLDRSEFANFVPRLHFDDCSTMTSDISIGEERAEKKKKEKEREIGHFKSREKDRGKILIL